MRRAQSVSQSFERTKPFWGTRASGDSFADDLDQAETARTHSHQPRAQGIDDLKKTYQHRLNELSSRIQRACESINDDELISTMNRDPSSAAHVQSRLKEVVEDVLNTERDVFLQVQSRELSAKDTEIAHLNNEIVRLTSQLRTASAQLRTFEEEIDVLTMKCTDAESQNALMSSQLQELSKQLAIETASRQRSDHELQRALDIVKSTLQKDLAFSEANKQLAEKNAQLTEQFERHAAATQAAEAKYDQCRRDGVRALEAVNHELQLLKDKAERDHKKLTKWEAVGSDLKSKLERAHADIHQAEALLAQSERERLELRSKFMGLGDKMEEVSRHYQHQQQHHQHQQQQQTQHPDQSVLNATQMSLAGEREAQNKILKQAAKIRSLKEKLDSYEKQAYQIEREKEAAIAAAQDELRRSAEEFDLERSTSRMTTAQAEEKVAMLVKQIENLQAALEEEKRVRAESERHWKESTLHAVESAQSKSEHIRLEEEVQFREKLSQGYMSKEAAKAETEAQVGVATARFALEKERLEDRIAQLIEKVENHDVVLREERERLRAQLEAERQGQVKLEANLERAIAEEKAENEKCREKIEELQRINDNLHTEISAKKHEILILESKTEKMAELEAQIHTHDERMTEALAHKEESMEAELERRQASFEAAMESLARERDALMAQLKETLRIEKEMAIEAKNRELEQLASEHKTALFLKEQAAQHTKRELDAAIEMKEHDAEVQKSLFEKEIQHTKREADLMEAEAQRQLARAEQEAASRQHELELSISQREKELAIRDKQIEARVGELNASSSRVLELQQEKGVLEMQLAEANANLRRSEAELTRSNDLSARLEKRVDELTALHSKLEKDLGTALLKANREPEYVENLRELRQQLNETRQKLINTEKQATESTHTNMSLKSKLENATKQNEELTRKYAVKRIELKRTAEAWRNLQVRMRASVSKQASMWREDLRQLKAAATSEQEKVKSWCVRVIQDLQWQSIEQLTKAKAKWDAEREALEKQHQNVTTTGKSMLEQALEEKLHQANEDWQHKLEAEQERTQLGWQRLEDAKDEAMAQASAAREQAMHAETRVSGLLQDLEQERKKVKTAQDLRVSDIQSVIRSLQLNIPSTIEAGLASSDREHFHASLFQLRETLQQAKVGLESQQADEISHKIQDATLPLQKIIEEKVQRIAELDTQLTSLREKLVSTTEEAENRYETAIAACENRRISEQAELVTKHQEELDELEERRQQEVDELNGELERVQDELQQAQEQLAASADEIEAFRRHLEETQASHSAQLAEQRSRFEDQILEIQRDNEDSLRIACEEAVQPYKDELSELAEQVDGLQQQYASEVESHRDTLAQRLQESDQRHVDEMRRITREYELKMDDLQQELSRSGGKSLGPRTPLVERNDNTSTTTAAASAPPAGAGGGGSDTALARSDLDDSLPYPLVARAGSPGSALRGRRSPGEERENEPPPRASSSSSLSHSVRDREIADLHTILEKSFSLSMENMKAASALESESQSLDRRVRHMKSAGRPVLRRGR